jgi:hypothetical protein
MSECWRCGRAVPEAAGTGYVFGVVCDRRECQQVKLGVMDRWKWFWFRASLGRHPRASAFGADGSYNYPRGYDESSLNTAVEAERMREGRADAA